MSSNTEEGIVAFVSDRYLCLVVGMTQNRTALRSLATGSSVGEDVIEQDMVVFVSDRFLCLVVGVSQSRTLLRSSATGTSVW